MNYKLKMETYPAVYRRADEEDGPGYYFGYVLAFGEVACSACGETLPELKENLYNVMRSLVEHYQEIGRTSIEIPDNRFIIPSGYRRMGNWMPNKLFQPAEKSL